VALLTNVLEAAKVAECVNPLATKGVLGFESPTRGWIGRSACGREEKKKESLIKLS
jgi:hypothetical protein